MDDNHLASALVYVAVNPVRARLVDRATDWPWSSVHAHLGSVKENGLTANAPVLDRFPDLASRIAAGENLTVSERLRKAGMTVRPVGSSDFIANLERQSGRRLRAEKPWPKGSEPDTDQLDALSP